MTLCTADGAIVTASLERFQVGQMGNHGDSDQWLHGLQPAWSLDTLWIRSKETSLRMLHAPHEVPLTRLTPEEGRPAASLSAGRHWRRNQSVDQSPLQSREHDFGWGFGVHAPSELTFELPPLATGVRAHASLDRRVGEGGCVQLRAYFQSTAGRPAYQSNFVVGSEETIDTGQLAVPQGDNEPTRLILQADSAHNGRPAGADPLDIRDMVNWYDPLIMLNEERLAAEVQNRAPAQIVAWKGWDLDIPDGGEVRFENRWDESLGDHEKQFALAAHAVEQPFTLSRRVNVNSRRRWLVALVYTYANHSEKPQLQVSIDGEQVADLAIPHHGSGRSGVGPLAVPLAAYQGQEVTIEITQTPGDERLPVRWLGITLTDSLPMLHALLEDEAVAMTIDPPDGAAARLTADDKHSGTHALVVNGETTIQLDYPDPLLIREHPAWGEYRYLRFAFRKRGGGRLGLELPRRDAEARPIRYDAGNGPPCGEGAIRVWTSNLPDEWVVMTRDLYADFGEAEIDSLLLTVPDGEAGLWDQIYLARQEADFAALATIVPDEARAGSLLELGPLHVTAPLRDSLPRMANARRWEPTGVDVVSVCSLLPRQASRDQPYPVCPAP